MKPVPKAIMLRDSVSRESEMWLDRFSVTMKIPNELLELTENQTEDDSLIQLARRNHIVSLATAYEIHWREFVRETVDSRGVSKTKLKKYQFTFSDLASILDHKLTLGELVASAFTFHGIEPLQIVADDVFNFDFLSALSRDEIEVTIDGTSSKMIKGKDIIKHRQQIDKCFEMRHLIVHDAGRSLNLLPENLEEMYGAMSMFCFFGAVSWLRKLSNNGIQRDLVPRPLIQGVGNQEGG